MRLLYQRWVELLAATFLVGAVWYGSSKPEPEPAPTPVPTPASAEDIPLVPCAAARLFIGAIPDRTGHFFTWAMPLDYDGKLIAYAECSIPDPVWTSVGRTGCYIVVTGSTGDLYGSKLVRAWSVETGGPPGAVCRIQAAIGESGIQAEKEIRIPLTIATRGQPPPRPSRSE